MSHNLSPLGFRKTPFTRELQMRERFPLTCRRYRSAVRPRPRRQVGAGAVTGRRHPCVEHLGAISYRRTTRTGTTLRGILDAA